MSWLKKDGYDAKKSEGLRALVKRVQRQHHKLPNSNQCINANASHKLNQIEKRNGRISTYLSVILKINCVSLTGFRRQVLDNSTMA